MTPDRIATVADIEAQARRLCQATRSALPPSRLPATKSPVAKAG
jgi:hypothetical protein